MGRDDAPARAVGVEDPAGQPLDDQRTRRRREGRPAGPQRRSGYGPASPGDQAAALRVQDVDLRRGRIEVSRASAEIKGRIVLGTPKSHQTRWLPVPKPLLEGVEAQVSCKAPDDLVFPASRGGYLRVATSDAATSTLPPGRSVDPASTRTSCGTRRPRWGSLRAPRASARRRARRRGRPPGRDEGKR